MGHPADSSTPETTSSPLLGRGPGGEVSAPEVQAGEVLAALEKVLGADTLRDSEMLKTHFGLFHSATELQPRSRAIPRARLGEDGDCVVPQSEPMVRIHRPPPRI